MNKLGQLFFFIITYWVIAYETQKKNAELRMFSHSFG